MAPLNYSHPVLAQGKPRDTHALPQAWPDDPCHRLIAFADLESVSFLPQCDEMVDWNSRGHGIMTVRSLRSLGDSV